MKCKTLKILLTNSKAMLDEHEMKKLCNIICKYSQFYVITGEYTPYNKVARYSPSIIIEKKSKEEAEPIANEIMELLKANSLFF